jgi:hypothetical protein
MTQFYHSGGSGHGPVGPQGIQGVQGDVGPGVINWLGTWSGTQAYGLNDAVVYNGSSYICIEAHTGSEPPSSKWDVLASKGAVGATGPQGDVGAAGATGPTGPTGLQGIQGIQGTQGVPGPQGQTGPRGLQGAAGADGSPGFVWKGAWDANVLYIPGDAVQHNGSTYFCLASNLNSEPPAAAWDLMAVRGDQGPPGP